MCLRSLPGVLLDAESRVAVIPCTGQTAASPKGRSAPFSPVAYRGNRSMYTLRDSALDSVVSPPRDVLEYAEPPLVSGLLGEVR